MPTFSRAITLIIERSYSPTTRAIGCPIPELTDAAQRRSRTFVRAHVEKRCLFMWDKTFLTLRLYIYECYALSESESDGPHGPSPRI